MAGLGKARQGKVFLIRTGGKRNTAGHGKARLGKAWLGKARCFFEERLCEI